jgi:adenylate cyclase
LALYLSPHQVKQILKEPDLLKPGARLANVSILFSDIANFSKISQRMKPEDLVRLLNEYYEAAIGCVHKTDGTVMNLIGDAIFAIWNAPQEQPDHQQRACQSALLLNANLIRFEASNRGLPLRTRIGLHPGTVCVGNIGSSHHFDFTAIGDAVNMASRLEGLNKHLGTNILATRNLQKEVEHTIVTRLVGHFKFKGFDSVVEVYELIAMTDAEEVTKPWRESFAKGIWNFQRQNLAEAVVNFQETLALRKEDGPSRFYLAEVAKLNGKNLGQEWMGEIDLTEK